MRGAAPFAILSDMGRLPKFNYRSPFFYMVTLKKRKGLPVFSRITRNAGLEETQAGIKIARRNINNLRYADNTTLVAESEEELKSLLMKVKE